MFRKILVPLDGSPLAETALQHAKQLATPGTTELILVNVIETYRYSFSSMEMVLVDTLSHIRRSMESYMNAQRDRLAAQHYTVQTHVIDGDAATGILDIAAATEADLIVMTTHGRSGVDRWILGSVAERVIHNATLPVWLVRENTPIVPLEKIERILVTLDGSAMAENALEPARQLAQQSGAELLLLRVVPQLDDVNPRMIFATQSSAQQALETWHSHAEQYLAQVAQEVAQEVEQKVASTGVTIRTRVKSGMPPQATLDAINTENINCIVMATHARLGVDRLLHGSVAAQVLQDCARPMLLIHATDASSSKVEKSQQVIA